MGMAINLDAIMDLTYRLSIQDRQTGDHLTINVEHFN